jgi:YidC/Oxa1 family membrane protein insertase
MLAFAPFQALLDAIGWVLASIFDLIPNYGVSIIILTLVIRLILLPLGIKQIKSMQAMQAIQPRVKELQKKYKGNKQKAQEETMKLYKEAGVNPLGGCLPLLLQFPILIAMYAVIRAPSLEPVPAQTPKAYQVMNNHLPEDSELFKDVITHTNTGMIFVNLQCSAQQSGTQAVLNDTEGNPVQNGLPLEDSEGNRLDETSIGTLDCGTGIPDKIPYFALLIVMIATTFYQQRQMQKASPPGAASSQQQAIMKFMPLMFGIFGFSFPAGLVLYWMTSNLFQIGQQGFLLHAGHIGPDALDRRIAEQRARQTDEPPKKGFFAGWMERAEQAREQQGKGTPPARGSSKGSSRGGTSKGSPKGGASGSRSGGAAGAKRGPRKPPPKNRPKPKPKDPGSAPDGS